jgi:putative DNA-invertase from lambdoid prophage Rac
MRVFAYCRVSTADQTTQNQVLEIRAAGFDVDAKRVIEESVSGSVAALERPGFAKLVDRLESGDVLIVSRIDRLGRSMIDVCGTVKMLSDLGVRVHCLQLGGADLTSPSGKMVMGVLATIAEFEKSLLIERVQSGLARARAQGIKLGRRPALNEQQREHVLQQLAAGVTVSALAREYGTTRQTIMRARDRATA